MQLDGLIIYTGSWRQGFFTTNIILIFRSRVNQNYMCEQTLKVIIRSMHPKEPMLEVSG